ncbi:MAG: PIG-L family deacetylase [Patescibacteria group bacterium]|jgi:LmbE family N-acetylglucosaminyl deacetylase
MKNNILVIAAHPDDEILGIGGTILKHIKNGDQVSILILGDGESSRMSATAVDIAKRKEQVKEVAKKLKIKNIFIDELPDNKFDSVSLLEIIKKIETIINKIKPNIIYTHHAHDLNIDHCLTFQAVLTVCRPQPDFFVKKILTFETLSSTEWQIKNGQNNFCPNEYVNIEKFINKKIEILEIYKDELRDCPHPRSIEGVKVLAKYRGMEVGYKYAEAFQVIRNLND